MNLSVMEGAFADIVRYVAFSPLERKKDWQNGGVSHFCN